MKNFETIGYALLFTWAIFFARWPLPSASFNLPGEAVCLAVFGICFSTLVFLRVAGWALEGLGTRICRRVVGYLGAKSGYGFALALSGFALILGMGCAYVYAFGPSQV